jgi:hypothetical protein
MRSPVETSASLIIITVPLPCAACAAAPGLIDEAVDRLGRRLEVYDGAK